MRLGDASGDERGCHSHRFPGTGRRPSASAACPSGRIVEIYGPESSGKTTLALHVLAEAQKMRRRGCLCGCRARAGSRIMRPPWAWTSKLMLVSQPDYRRAGIWRSRMPWSVPAPSDVVVVDSVAALTPRAEIEGEMGEAFVGLQARLMSQALRKLAGTVCQDQLHRHLHQPAAYEDRRHVRKPRDHRPVATP